MTRKQKIFTAADARAERVRADARMMVRERKAAIADAQRRATRAAARYAEFGGSIHRLTRMRTARRLRELLAAPI
jgi:hypothetical protein